MDLLRDMALFVAVARARSFTRAAERLGMPTSSLSRRITELERRLGVKLLERTTRRVELTSAGAVYLARCAAIVDEARNAHEHLQELVSVPRGHIRISLTGDFGAVFVAPYLVEFREKYPEITFDLDMSPRRVDLLTEAFDLALRIGALEESTLIARRLALLKVGLYAAPQYLSRRGTPRRPEDLSQFDAIRVLAAADGAFWTLYNGKETRRIPLTSPFTANSIGMIRMLTLRGAGIGVIDEAMVREDVRSGRLVHVLPKWILDSVPVHAVTASRSLPAKTRVLIEFLAGRMAQLNTG